MRRSIVSCLVLAKGHLSRPLSLPRFLLLYLHTPEVKKLRLLWLALLYYFGCKYGQFALSPL